MSEVSINTTTGKAKIILDDSNINIRLFFKNYKVQLKDNSSTGKTFLFNLLTEAKKIDEILLQDVILISEQNMDNLEHTIKNSKDKIIIIDDIDTIFVKEPSIISTIRNDIFDNFYLLIGRGNWNTGVHIKELATLDYTDSTFRFKYSSLINSKRELEKCYI